MPGRRAPAYSRHGSPVRAVPDGHGIHIVGTIRAAADRGARIENQLLQLRPEDVRGQLRRGKESNLIVFLVDASGSMAARDRLAAVTGAVHSLLGDAYKRRDKVAVISVRGQRPELVLPPTGSIDIAMRRLSVVETGGRTPLAEGLIMAKELVEREYRREPGRRALLVVLSDGRATGPHGLSRLYQAAQSLARRDLLGSVVIDCERGNRIRLGLAGDLARHLGGACVQVDALDAAAVTGIIDTGFVV